MHVCTEPGCGTLVHTGRCTTHGGQRSGVPRRNAPGSVLRAVHRRAHGRCERCRRRTTQLTVHHVLPYSEGGSHDLSNLLALCSSCHALAHHALNRARGVG
jgi:5-methylcytosine-specific restriction enzyme A